MQKYVDSKYPRQDPHLGQNELNRIDANAARQGARRTGQKSEVSLVGSELKQPLSLRVLRACCPRTHPHALTRRRRY